MLALAALVGLAIQYAFGVVGLILRAGMDLGAALAAQLPFIGFDLLKVVLIVVIAAGVHAAFPDLRERRPARANTSV